ncbi:MAG: hypothetical protein WD490_04250 [Opitutales bacterium]
MARRLQPEGREPPKGAPKAGTTGNGIGSDMTPLILPVQKILQIPLDPDGDLAEDTLSMPAEPLGSFGDLMLNSGGFFCARATGGTRSPALRKHFLASRTDSADVAGIKPAAPLHVCALRRVFFCPDHKALPRGGPL